MRKSPHATSTFSGWDGGVHFGKWCMICFAISVSCAVPKFDTDLGQRDAGAGGNAEASTPSSGGQEASVPGGGAGGASETVAGAMGSSIGGANAGMPEAPAGAGVGGMGGLGGADSGAKKEGTGCAATSDCDEGFVCTLAACRWPCSSDLDCSRGALCSGVEQPFGCSLADELSCSAGSCPEPLVCALDGKCRISCDTAEDCPRNAHDCRANVCVSEFDPDERWFECDDGETRCEADILGTSCRYSCSDPPECHRRMGCRLNGMDWGLIEMCGNCFYDGQGTSCQGTWESCQAGGGASFGGAGSAGSGSPAMGGSSMGGSAMAFGAGR